MLKLPQRASLGSEDKSLIPLINVVFLLLAFFMISGQVQHEGAQRVEIPASTSDLDQEEEHDLVIVMTKDGDLAINGEIQSIDQLSGRIDVVAAASNNEGELRTLLRADATLPAVTLRDLLTELREAGLPRVSVATLPDQINSSN